MGFAREDIVCGGKYRCTMKILESALHYAARGWKIHPCKLNKKPYLTEWPEKATSDPEQIKKWWKQWPDASIGCCTGGVSGFWALDIDLPDGPGEAEKMDLPETLTQRTGGGGYQKLFLCNGEPIRNSAGKIARKIDVRGNGGYVILPPSPHPSGGRYEWINESEIATAPHWLIEKASKQSAAPRASVHGTTTPYGRAALADEITTLSSAREGERNDTLNRSAYSLGQLIAGGELDEGTVRTGLLSTALMIGLGRGEAEKTLDSGITQGKEHPRKPERTEKASDSGDICDDRKSFSAENTTTLQASDPMTFPDGIMGGAAGYFAEVMSSCMEAPAHFFFLSYLTCLGSLLAGRVTLKTELKPQPRLYMVLLGESADDRKSTAINRTVEFFQKTIADFRTCFGVGSAEGLQKRFIKDNNILLVFDELKAFVGKSKVDGSVLLPCVCTLFESNRYESHTRDREVILEGAGLSILSASTIETYERTWDSAFTDIGMTNRLFIVPGRARRRFAIPKQIETHEKDVIKQELLEVLKTASLIPELDITPEALTLYEEWYLNLEHSVHTKRLDTYALRFLILFAINARKTEVDTDIVRAVIQLMNWQLEARRLHDPIDADSAIATIEEKLRRVLKKEPLSDRDLKRAVNYHRVGLWVYNAALSNLKESEEISFQKRDKVWMLK